MDTATWKATRTPLRHREGEEGSVCSGTVVLVVVRERETTLEDDRQAN
jgi:hypothetical protein